MRIVVVLPAPFGPRKPKDSPCATSKSTWSTAVKPAYRFVSPRAWMSGESCDSGVSGMGPHGTAAACQGPSRIRILAGLHATPFAKRATVR